MLGELHFSGRTAFVTRKNEKISLLGPEVSEIEMSYLHFKSKFARK